MGKIYMKIGSLIKKIRTIRGLTQVQLAQKMGITQNYLSLIETDNRTPSHAKFKELAKHLQLSEDALIFLSTEPPEELEQDKKRDYVKLQHNILSLLVFDLTGDIEAKIA